MKVRVLRNVNDGIRRLYVNMSGGEFDVKKPRVIDYVETKDQKISEGVSTLYGTVYRVYECDGDVWFTTIGFSAAYAIELDKSEVVKYGDYKDSTKLSGGHMW